MTVSYVTAPFVLRRHARDLARAGIPAPGLPPEPAADEAVVAPGSVNLVDDEGAEQAKPPGRGRKLVLEDLDLKARVDDGSLRSWAAHVAQVVHPEDPESQHDVIHRFALLPDAILDFLAETATEVRARIALDPETGAAKPGALWYEENLPAEAVLWGVFALSASNNPNDPRSEEDLARAMPASGTLLQLGGKAGAGRGLVRFLTGEAPA